MIPNVSEEDVVEYLSTYFEGRLDNEYQAGKQEMINAVHEKFGMSKDEAHNLIDYLERKNTIRYITGSGTEHEFLVDQHWTPKHMADNDEVIVAPMASGLATGYPIHQAVAFMPHVAGSNSRKNEYIEQGVGYWAVGRPD